MNQFSYNYINNKDFLISFSLAIPQAPLLKVWTIILIISMFTCNTFIITFKSKNIFTDFVAKKFVQETEKIEFYYRFMQKQTEIV